MILLGPVFIPWLLFEPLAFLFWGWFRTLMVYTLYGVVAGAILRVFMGVGMGYVTTYTGALMGTGSSDPAELGLWVVVLLPLVVSGLMAGMKVGELAAMLVSGSGSVGSGMMALVVRGGGRLTAAASTRRSGARPSRRTGSSGRCPPSWPAHASRSACSSSGSRPSSRPGPSSCGSTRSAAPRPWPTRPPRPRRIRSIPRPSIS